MRGCNPSYRRISFFALAFFLVFLILRQVFLVEPPDKFFNDPQLSNLTFGTENPFFRLFEPVRTPVDAPTYVDASGRKYAAHKKGPWWRTPLNSEILIVDIDTRVPDGQNELWADKKRLEWAKMPANGDGGMMSASLMNHFLYAQIHGYDYRFYNARPMERQGYHNTWVKPHILRTLLPSYKFVVFADADATFTHLGLPLEWLFNRWGIMPNTSIGMPLDTAMNLNGDTEASNDSKGNRVLNAGFIIAQNSAYTLDLLDAWSSCTDEKRYAGCAQWKQSWSHEQRAFSEYVRYDYNRHGVEVIEIPCDDAMGYPGFNGHQHILSKCEGVFLRHHTIDKEWTKNSTEEGILQSFTDLVHNTLMRGRGVYRIQE